MNTSLSAQSSQFIIRSLIAASAGISIFLIWLIYFKAPAAGEHAEGIVSYLPAVNATFNALSAMCLVLGYVFIRNKNIRVHRYFMFSALTFSGLFLVSYLIYHHFHGDTPFEGTGVIRPVYFFILITHIVLSIGVLPMVLITVFRALTNQVDHHRRIARITFPIWLYVSVTGILVFLILNVVNHAG